MFFSFQNEGDILLRIKAKKLAKRVMRINGSIGVYFLDKNKDTRTRDQTDLDKKVFMVIKTNVRIE